MSPALLARVALAVYLGAVLALTLIALPGDPDRLNLIPLRGILRTFEDRGIAYGTLQVVGNLLLLAPAGALLPAAVPGVRLRHVVLGALAVSLAIEVGQLGVSGRSADIDDLWTNTLSAAIGYAAVGYAAGVPRRR
ncbi:MAG TPA: VanZ family protein [candidate division Zixibacteria bacterium]|nr:VanZ family protein [candidate division Zixibacteria bacterium]